jgi:hypothetical protein
MGGVRGPVGDQIGVGTQRQAIEAAVAWGFRPLHFKCSGGMGACT